MGQQRVGNIALFNTKREYANSAVDNDTCVPYIIIFDHQNEHRYNYLNVNTAISFNAFYELIS